jgi:hypothetical protein
MTQGVNDLIKAIAEGDSQTIDAAFNAEMSTRISARLEDMRVQVAQSMFKNPVAESIEETEEEVSEEEVVEEAEEIEEEVEQIDELSKKTMGSYVKKAADDKEYHGGAEAFMTRHDVEPEDDDEVEELEKTRKALANRTKGIATAVKKLTK